MNQFQVKSGEGVDDSMNPLMLSGNFLCAYFIETLSFHKLEII
jgi:hypothetical protein